MSAIIKNDIAVLRGRIKENKLKIKSISDENKNLHVSIKVLQWKLKESEKEQ